MMKEISKNDLHEVVLVGKGPELQTLYSKRNGNVYFKKLF